MMAEGDITSDIIDMNTSAINTAVATLKVTNSDTWIMSPCANDQQVVVINIEGT